MPATRTHPEQRYSDKGGGTSEQHAKPVGHTAITCSLPQHNDWPGTKGKLVTLSLEGKGRGQHNKWAQLAAISVDGVMASNGDEYADPSFTTDLPDWVTHYRTVLNVERASTHAVDVGSE